MSGGRTKPVQFGVPRDEQAERITDNFNQADFSTMSFADMEAIFEDRDIAEFL